ncbi:MAG: LicD family protein [Alphaproteobacteria bacterium]|nr:LicD family protein [Alphaproteobacteria bacterium]
MKIVSFVFKGLFLAAVVAFMWRIEVRLRHVYDEYKYRMYNHHNEYLKATDLNNVLDIRQCPKARGKLRKLQIADTLLLRIFHNICEKHKIPYSLEGGALIGAMRHNGFIPWDDDLDVCVLWDDYEKLVDVLTEEFKGTNLELVGLDKTRHGDDTLRISHKKCSTLNLDVFWLLQTKCGLENKEKMKELWKKHHTKYYKDFSHINSQENAQVLREFKKNFIDELSKDVDTYASGKGGLFHQVAPSFCFMGKDDFFPLQKHEFEGYEFWIPNNPDRMLTDFYGDWMSFPSTLWRHGFDKFDEQEMDEVITELEGLLKNKFKAVNDKERPEIR